MSQVTTHVLDTAKGKPAAGITVTLYTLAGYDWEYIAKGTTNADGRITDLLAQNELLDAGVYKLKFDIQVYFDNLGIDTFYPLVEIVFRIKGSGDHYHVPLLLNPYGYSTYRGS